MSNNNHIGKRSGVDFSSHVMDTVINDDIGLRVYHLHKPNTIVYSVKFINVEGILVVTGDVGRWSFCREFIPSSDGYVSDHYWNEKLKISSTQNPYEFDSKVAQEDIAEILRNEGGYDLTDEIKEWLKELAYAAEEGEMVYNGKCCEYPSGFNTERMPSGHTLNVQLAVVYDAFDEMCNRIKTKENNYETI